MAFATSTIVLIAIWYQHYLYFLRFGLKNKRTVVLNTFLLLVVLFYVYPLKFVISFMLRYLGYNLLILLGIDFDQEAFHTLVISVSSWETLPTIMIIYSAGYFSLMLAFALLYRHANRQKEVLSLTDWERWKSARTMYQYFIQASVAIISMIISLVAEWTGAPWYAIAGGFVYFLVGLAIYVLDRVFEKKRPSESAEVLAATSTSSIAVNTSVDSATTNVGEKR